MSQLTRLLLLTAIFSLACSGQSYNIGTFVGGGANAVLKEPSGITLDSSGNLYIADTFNAVLKVTPSGMLSIVAGNYGPAGSTGDGGQATSAALYSPSSVAVDSSGNLYIADLGNNRVRKVTPGGTISTVAGGGTPVSGNGDGGPATSASLSAPGGVAVDSAGNLYISEGGISGSRIRKVTAGGTISTIAGNGMLAFSGDGGPAVNASINTPLGIALDSAGNLYIADGGNSRIRKVNTSGIISTFAGTGTLGFAGDGGPAASAVLNVPTWVSTDAAGNVYICDSGNERIRLVNPQGVISTIAGNGVLGTTGDGGPATNAELNVPFGIVAANNGNVYVSDGGDGRIRLLTPAASGSTGSPAISSGAIVPLYSTVATIQPGEWVSIFGKNLASTTTSWNGDFPTSLGGTSVTIDGKPAYLYFVSPGQINLQAPDDSAAGTVPVVVTTAAGSSMSTVTLAQFGPSFSLLDAKHVAGLIIRTNGYDIVGPTGSSLGYPTVAAKAGDVVELFCVGLGPTNPEVPAGKAFSGAAPTTNPVTLTINGKTVPTAFTGLSSAGLYQINFTVPSGLGTGDVSLQATVGGVQTPSSVVISLQ